MPNTKLTRFQVAKIKAILMYKHEYGINLGRVAERFGVAYVTIYDIYTGANWRTVRPYKYLDKRELDGLSYNRSRGKYQRPYDRKGA